MKNPTRIIDLTHVLSPEIPSFDGDCCFSMNLACDYEDCAGPDLFRVQNLELKAGSGTHMDAPAHCIRNGKTVDVLDLEDLITDCIVIHVDADEHYVAMPEVVHQFEERHGPIPVNAFVIFHTGWSKYWDDAKRYRNDLNFPAVHEETAKLLLERNVSGIGIDTLSPDAGGTDFPVHRVMLGAGKYLVENVANADLLPPTGSQVIIAPMKIKGGTEAPVRLAALLFD